MLENQSAMEQLLSAWQLDQVRDVTRVAAGSVNQVYCVRTAAAIYFLRTYRTTDEAIVEREHRLIAHMQAASIPAVMPIAARDGHTVITAHGLVHALYPHAVGTQVARAALTPDHAHAAGCMLAQIHGAARALPDTGYRHYQLAWSAANWLARLGRIEQAIRARPHLDQTDHWALERVCAQQQWLADPACPHSCTPRAAAQVTHGDYHDANLFFGPAGVSGVIDWEQAAYMPRAYELVRAASYMFDLRPALTRHFLQAYCTHSDIGPQELEEGAHAWGVMSDHYVWAPEEVYLNGNDRARRFIPQYPFRPFLQAWAEVRTGELWRGA